MFDIGFWELALIGVVALLVIGPERLPAVARTAGAWWGKFSRFVGGVKSDIDRELKADELKRIMQQQSASVGLHDIIEDTKKDLKTIEQETSGAADAAGLKPNPDNANKTRSAENLDG
jgi:sec-independent protein translocase protein TatB